MCSRLGRVRNVMLDCLMVLLIHAFATSIFAPMHSSEKVACTRTRTAVQNTCLVDCYSAFSKLYNDRVASALTVPTLPTLHTDLSQGLVPDYCKATSGRV